jgi:CHAT domain-containing protein/tetratricopeptide (TPR) repeat protein
MSRQSVFVRFPQLILLIVTLMASSGSASAQFDVTTLSVGKPIERKLAGGQVHVYELDLPLNDYAEVVVDQRSIDVSVTAYDPKGQKLTYVDGLKVPDQESLLLIGATPGPYRLEIRSPFAKAPEGTYQIGIKELRTASEKDKNSVAAWRLVAEGLELDRQTKAASWRQAIEKYQEALPLWRAAGFKTWEANALYLIANNYIFLGEKQKAFEYANQAVPLAHAAASEGDEDQRVKSVKVEAYALDIVGRIYNEFGDKKKAIEVFNQALPLHRSISDRSGELFTVSLMASAYQYMGDMQRALSLYDEATAIAKEVGDHAREGTILNNVCALYDNVGNYKQALDYCSRALTVRRDFKDRLGEAVTVSNLGNVYASLGDFQQALDLYNQSEAIYRSIGNRSGQGIAFNNIGWLYATIGDYEKAIDFYNKGIEIFTAEDDQYRLGNVLNNLAANYSLLGDYKKALELNLKVLPLRRAVNNIDGAGVTLHNIANAYAHLDDKQKALETYNESLKILRDGNPRQLTAALRNLGSLYLDLGEQPKAASAFNEALKVSRSIGDRASEAAALAKLARLEVDRGNLLEAKHLTETTLASVESLRVNLKSQQMRAAFFASVRDYHELYIEILMRLHQQYPTGGYNASALSASENARARSLLELLMEAKAQIRQGVDPSLVEREQKIRQAISAKAELQMRLLSDKHNKEDGAKVGKELDALANDYEEVQTKIRQTSPRYAALTQPSPLSVKEIQSRVLDENTLLLEYSLGEKKSYLWVAGATSLTSFELPGRAEVESVARRVYDLITASDQKVQNESIEERRKRLARADVEYPEAVERLSRMLLGPAASELKTKRLIIVGDGVLQYVPFAALVEPRNAGAGQPPLMRAQTPLIVNHEIITLPSASVLDVLRQESKHRFAASRMIAVFADPVFDTGDARLVENSHSRATQLAASSDRSEIKRSAEESGLAGFPRLRFSRDEADQIIRLAQRNKSFEALDFAASRAAATSEDLQNYRVVHFATHGIINSRHAELSGIVLSLVDQDGKPQDGFLRLYDIYNMHLKADMVVLSACQTALGREIKGEGLIGLTRAFMYGGASRVVASLWQTDDRATAVLMGRFYDALLSRRLSGAAALRSAQISMWQDKRWREPRYWAAFTLQGEWK